MKRTIRSISGLLAVVILSLNMLMLPSSAQKIVPYSSEYINSYLAYLTARGGGKVEVGVVVMGVTTMDEIGAELIDIYESTDDGDTWHWVYTYTNILYPEMMGSGNFYNDTPVTYPGTAGNQYYAVVTVYAGDHTGHDTREYTTNPIIAR